jgi:hypothetical protein
MLAKLRKSDKIWPSLPKSAHLPKLPEKLPIMVLLHPDIFIEPGSCMLHRHAKFITESNEFRWRATFGAPPQICCDIWHRISPETTMPNGVQYDHLLWGLLQMKLYPSEPSACAIAAGCGEAPDEKTYRKWSKLFVSAISLQSTSVVSDEAPPNMFCEMHVIYLFSVAIYPSSISTAKDTVGKPPSRRSRQHGPCVDRWHRL